MFPFSIQSKKYYAKTGQNTTKNTDGLSMLSELNPDYAIDSQRNLQIQKRQVFEKIF